MGINDTPDEVTVFLDTDETLTFKNPEKKGYRFADRIRGKAAIGEEISVAMQNGNVTNFKIGDNWDISRALHAVIGNVAFLDEGRTQKGTQYIRVNQSIYKGKNSDGENVYDSAYIYFDNSQNADMINSVREKLSQGTPNVIVCSKNQNVDRDNIYSGFYFVPIKK